MCYSRFFYTDRTFYRPVPYPMHKKIYKSPLNFYLLKVKKNHGYSVKMRVLGQNNQRGVKYKLCDVLDILLSFSNVSNTSHDMCIVYSFDRYHTICLSTTSNKKNITSNKTIFSI